MLRPTFHFFVSAATMLVISGCTTLVDAVVDDSDPEPGGKLEATIAGQGPVSVLALAQGDPMIIQGQSPNLVVAMTCGDDITGRTASSALAAAGGKITLMITAMTRTQLQVHAGGMSCAATSGQIQLSTDATNAIAGTFAADGVIYGSTTPCSVSGTLNAIPQYR